MVIILDVDSMGHYSHCKVASFLLFLRSVESFPMYLILSSEIFIANNFSLTNRTKLDRRRNRAFVIETKRGRVNFFLV